VVFGLFWVFRWQCGVRQGGILSQHLSVVYLDDLIKNVAKSNLGCHIRYACCSILVYADDILLLAPSVTALQELLLLCNNEINELGLQLNCKKSVCIRIGKRFDYRCAKLFTCTGNELEWVSQTRYLGTYIVSSFKFKCNYEQAKKAFFRSFNAVYGRIGRSASEEVILHLIRSKCLQALLYGSEVCSQSAADIKPLNFTLRRTIMKVFHLVNNNIIDECQEMFGMHIEQLIAKRRVSFLNKLKESDNLFF
jgi:hypothetical protein